MAEVKIIISSTDQMKNFIFFLYKSGFQPTLEKDQSFYELLYKSIKEKKIYPVWLKEKNTSEFLKTLNTMYCAKLYYPLNPFLFIRKHIKRLCFLVSLTSPFAGTAA